MGDLVRRGGRLIQRLLMLMLWMCCLSFAQEEKNELGLLLGAKFIPRAATISNQKLSFGRSVAYSVDYARRLSSGNTALLLEFPFAAGPSHRVESAQLNAITSLATLFVTPSLRAQFVSHAPARRGNRRPHPAQTAVPDRLQRRVSGLLHVRKPQFRRSGPALRTA